MALDKKAERDRKKAEQEPAGEELTEQELAEKKLAEKKVADELAEKDRKDAERRVDKIRNSRRWSLALLITTVIATAAIGWWVPAVPAVAAGGLGVLFFLAIATYIFPEFLLPSLKNAAGSDSEAAKKRHAAKLRSLQGRSSALLIAAAIVTALAWRSAPSVFAPTAGVSSLLFFIAFATLVFPEAIVPPPKEKKDPKKKQKSPEKEKREKEKKEYRRFAQGEQDDTIRFRSLRSLIKIVAALIVMALAWRLANLTSGIVPVALGFVFSLTMTVFVAPGYWLCRDIVWKLYRKKLQDKVIHSAVTVSAKADPENKNEPEPEPEDYPGVDIIDAAEHRTLSMVPVYQGIARGKLYAVAAMPTLGLLNITLREMYWSNHAFGAGMAFGDIVFLTIVIWYYTADRMPTESWVSNRCLSEILRREQYLCLGELGLYGTNPVSAASRRLDVFKDDKQLSDLKPLIHIGEFNPSACAISPDDTPPDSAEVEKRLKVYTRHRIQKQIGHMSWALKDAKGTSAWLRKLLAATALATFAIAIIKTQSLSPESVSGLKGNDPAKYEFSQDVVAFAKFLPSAAGLALALSGLLRLQLLEKIYTEAVHNLKAQEKKARELIHDVVMAAVDKKKEFQKLVFAVEEIMTDELQMWIMVTDRQLGF